MVTPGNGVLVFRGMKSGNSYIVNFYSSDVLTALNTFNLNGLAVAGSTTFYVIPEDCVLEDISFASSNTVSTAWVVQLNDANTSSVIQIATVLTTLATRIKPLLRLPKGAKFGMVQA